MREQTEQTVVCAACEDGKTVVRVTLDRKCVECGKYVSDDPRPLRRMTFAELVEYGRANDGNIVNGMPWSFTFNGVSISHENDECYLVNAFGGTQRFTPRDTLAVGPFGQLVVLYAPTPPSDAGTSERETPYPPCAYCGGSPWEHEAATTGRTICRQYRSRIVDGAAAPAAEGPHLHVFDGPLLTRRSIPGQYEVGCACGARRTILYPAPTLPEPRPDDEGREKPACPDVIRRAADELARLCAGPGRLTHHRLAGRNWTMCVPVHHSDSDVIFGDLIEAAAKWHLASVTPHPAPLGATDEGRRDLPNSMWPVVVLQDRYSGSYAGGEWIAVSNGDDPARLQAVWDGAHGSDGHAMEFWGAHEPRPWLAVGDSPSAAVAALRAALQAGG